MHAERGIGKSMARVCQPTIYLATGFLAACGEASTAPSAGPVQLGMPSYFSTALGGDSLLDSFTVQSREADGSEPRRVWLRISATSGEPSVSRVRTDADGFAAFTWRLAVPAAGTTEQLTVCVAPSKGDPCAAGAVSLGASHTSP